MMKKSLFVLLLGLVVWASPVWAAEKEYVIGKGDTLSIQVWGEDTLSSSALVRPDGRISLPGAGVVTAAGLTSGQLAKRIAGKLSEIVHSPVVSVQVMSFPNNSVVVHGPGVRSSVVPIQGSLTMLQLLSQVAPDANADLQNAYLERSGKRIASDFRALFQKGETEGNLELEGGDRLFVPLRENRLIFVEGAVVRPTAMQHYDGMKILEAIHMAGGFTKFADKNDTVILRSGPDGQQSIQVRLYDLTEKGDFSQNLPLEGGDIIVVKKSWF